MSIQLPLSLRWAAMLTWREEGQARGKELQGSIVLGVVSPARGPRTSLQAKKAEPTRLRPSEGSQACCPKHHWASSVLPAPRNHVGPRPAVPVLGRVQPQPLCPCPALIPAALLFLSSPTHPLSYSIISPLRRWLPELKKERNVEETERKSLIWMLLLPSRVTLGKSHLSDAGFPILRWTW